MNSRPSPVRRRNTALTGRLFLLIVILSALSIPAAAQAPASPAGAPAAAGLDRLRGFDAWMEQVVKDWNVPGIGVGVVIGDKLVFARGYGYRDYGRKIPFTPQTTAPIASNTKLFTATAVGLLVDEGKLEWDKPVRDFVPGIEFYNDDLNRSVSIRDMLSHRTGITRHDLIWYKSDFSRRQLFERLQYLEPKQPIRTTFLYNNMMYTGAGYVVELLSGKTWEEFVRERLLQPLGMTSTTFTIDEMTRQPDCGVPFTEKRDSFELYQIPYYSESIAVGPAGAINSNLEDMSHWLIALLNRGRYEGRQVIPAAVVKATTEPATPMPNTQLEARGWGEMLNAVYGMGRWTASYRGHLLAYHGGDINGFHSQVSCMPQDSIGVVVLVIGDHCASLYNVVSFNVYERLLGLDQTPWSERQLAIRLKAKEADKQARAASGGDRVPKTRPSHPLEAYLGEFEHPAYGVLAISMKEGGLFFDFHKVRLPLSHYHYDRFETPDDEELGKWSVNFQTNPQGDVDQALISLDEAEVTFTRRVAAGLSAIPTLQQYAGTYATPTGASFQVVVKETGAIGIVFPGQPFQEILPWKPHQFRIKEFADVVVGFVVEGGRVVAMTQSDPSGTYRFPRK